MLLQIAFELVARISRSPVCDAVVDGIDPVLRSPDVQTLLLVVNRPKWRQKLGHHLVQEILAPEFLQRNESPVDDKEVDNFSSVRNVAVVQNVRIKVGSFLQQIRIQFLDLEKLFDALLELGQAISWNLVLLLVLQNGPRGRSDDLLVGDFVILDVVVGADGCVALQRQLTSEVHVVAVGQLK